MQHVLRETWRDAYGSFIPQADLDVYFERHYHLPGLRTMLRSKGVDGLVAELDGEVVGFARTIFERSEKRFTVASLYVLPAHQGKGIGSDLLAHAEELAKGLGVDIVWLGVMEQNTPALKWYRRIGFTFVEEAPFVMGSTTVQHLIGYRRIRSTSRS